jgi:hypothetical protein
LIAFFVKSGNITCLRLFNVYEGIKMLKSSLLFMSFCLVLFVGNVNMTDAFGANPAAPPAMPGMPGMPGALPTRQRDARPAANEAVATAQQEIETQLNTLLAAVNQGTELNKAELTQIAATIKKNQQQLQKMDAKGQAGLHLMNAWMNYFVGELKKAKVAANLAYRADPQDKDAQTTYIIMAIANNDVKAAATAVTLLRKKPAKPAAKNQQTDASLDTHDKMAGTAILEFDANSLKTELLGEKVGAFEAACLNGTSLPFKGGKTLLVLLWKNADLSTDTATDSGSAPQPMTMPAGMPGMPGAIHRKTAQPSQTGQVLTPLQVYGTLFGREFQSNKIAFLGLNLDVEDQSGAVMETLLKNSWPWPQAMAQDTRNVALASLSSAHIDKPALVVVGPDGEIKYAGALSGFLLRVMAASAQGGSEATLAMPQTIQTHQDANTSAPAAATQTKEANIPPAAVPQPTTPQPKAKLSEEDQFNPQAEALYNNAKGQMKMAYATGYGNVVNFCRQILKDYPNTPQAEKARQLLREIPERKRAQYHITNKEMGL